MPGIDKTSDAVSQVRKLSETNPEDMSLEAMVLLLTTDYVRELESKMRNEFKELKSRQDKVRFLHKLIKAINKSTDDKGKIDWSDDEELKELLDLAREMGVEIPEDQYKFKEAEKNRLLENLRMTVDDLNVENDLQLQTITRLTNERYEAFQMARSIMKPLHEDKVNKARKLAS